MKQRYRAYAKQLKPSDQWLDSVEDKMIGRFEKKNRRHNMNMRIGIAVCLMAVTVIGILPFALPKGEDVTVLAPNPTAVSNTIIPETSVSPASDHTAEPYSVDFIDTTTLNHTDGFYIHNMSFGEDAVIFSGRSFNEDFSEHVPAIEYYSSDFELQWFYEDENIDEVMHDTIEVGDMVIAMRTGDVSGESAHFIQHIRDGELVFESNGLPWSSGLYPATDGYFVAYHRRNGACNIEKYDLSGVRLSKLSIEGAAAITGVIPTEDGMIAIGSKRLGSKEPRMGFIIAYSNEGEVLWQSQSQLDTNTDRECEFIDIVPVADHRYAVLAREPEGGGRPWFVEIFSDAGSEGKIDLEISGYMGTAYGLSIDVIHDEIWTATLFSYFEGSTFLFHRVSDDGGTAEPVHCTTPLVIEDLELMTFGDQTYCLGLGRVFEQQDDLNFDYIMKRPWFTVVKELAITGPSEK